MQKGIFCKFSKVIWLPRLVQHYAQVIVYLEVLSLEVMIQCKQLSGVCE